MLYVLFTFIAKCLGIDGCAWLRDARNRPDIRHVGDDTQYRQSDVCRQDGRERCVGLWRANDARCSGRLCRRRRGEAGRCDVAQAVSRSRSHFGLRDSAHARRSECDTRCTVRCHLCTAVRLARATHCQRTRSAWRRCRSSNAENAWLACRR